MRWANKKSHTWTALRVEQIYMNQFGIVYELLGGYPVSRNIRRYLGLEPPSSLWSSPDFEIDAENYMVEDDGAKSWNIK